MNQTIIERAMLSQYCEKQKAVKAARGIKPSVKDIKNKAANNRIAHMIKWGKLWTI